MSCRYRAAVPAQGGISGKEAGRRFRAQARGVLIALLLVALAVAGCATPTAPPKLPAGPPSEPLLEERYDSNRDSTTLRLVPAATPAQAPKPQLFVGATVPGRQLAPPEQVLLGFRVSGAGWATESCRELTLIADGQLVGRMPLSRDSQLGGGQLTEYLSAVFPFVSIQLFAAARQPQALLCQSELSLTSVEQAKLRELVGRFLGAGAQ